MAKKKHTVANTRVTTTHVVLPGDTNTHGTIFGGKVMQWIDIAGAIAAARHCRKPVVTASIDDLHFLHSIGLGYIVNINAQVSHTGRTSMDVDVEVFSEDPKTGKKHKTSIAFLTFVAIDKQSKPLPVPAVVPETKEEMQSFAAAKRRREARIKRLREADIV